MELGELASVAMPAENVDKECPFSHEKPNLAEKNELGGIGTKLGDNMAAGKGVHTSAPPVGTDFSKGAPAPDPRLASIPLKFVFITINGSPVTVNGTPLPYPLTCAAHHLIPAQESLKESPILNFMCKQGEEQDFRSGKAPAPAPVSGSKVWGNVAYNVNGCQNGVWLPGNYAVGAGIGGIEVWKAPSRQQRTTHSDAVARNNWQEGIDLTDEEWASMALDPEEDEEPQSIAEAMATAVAPQYMLTGKNHSIHAGNPKWSYVKAAMDASNGQFHDRHEPYSREVAKYLIKIAEAYEQMYDRSAAPEAPCEKCEEARRPVGASASLIGPPYNIVSRLVRASEFFKRHVLGPTLTAKNIYTSKWVKVWMDKKETK